MRAEWPPEWIRLRDRVRDMAREQAYVSSDRFRDIQLEVGMTDEVAQHDVAGQLHIMGEIIYFRDRQELADLVILNPAWVAELIALVVRSEVVHNRGGLLRHNDLADIWRNHTVTEAYGRVRPHLCYPRSRECRRRR
jgi:hypothetical protein